MKNSQKKRFFKKSFEKNPQSRFFFKTFFDEIVAEDPGQFVAKTLCPYLGWLLRNLPHKFEKLALVAKSAKKNIGATGCRTWARAETFIGLQKVLQILCVPGTYLSVFQ